MRLCIAIDRFLPSPKLTCSFTAQGNPNAFLYLAARTAPYPARTTCVVHMLPEPKMHRFCSTNEACTPAISVALHPANFAVEAGKVYYLLPKRWGEDAGYSYTMAGSVVVPQRSATAHSTFTFQAAAASAAPPPQFDRLSYSKVP